MLNKKGRTPSILPFILIAMVAIYVMNFGGFRDVFDTAIGNSTANSTGMSQHIAIDSSAHAAYVINSTDKQTEFQQPEYENTNIEPSFIRDYGLAVIVFIAVGLIIGYLVYKYKKNKWENNGKYSRQRS